MTQSRSPRGQQRAQTKPGDLGVNARQEKCGNPPSSVNDGAGDFLAAAGA